MLLADKLDLTNKLKLNMLQVSLMLVATRKQHMETCVRALHNAELLVRCRGRRSRSVS